METRIQFRIDEQTKQLAQLMAQSQGKTISQACRELTEELAKQQLELESHERWLSEQINFAFEKLENGETTFVEQNDAKSLIEQRKNAIRNKSKS